MDQSQLSLNRSTVEERKKNLSYIRLLYILFAFSLIIALTWASICLKHWPGHGSGKWWIFGLIFGILCLLLVLAVFFVKALAKTPIAWGVYGLFVICLAAFMGWAVCADNTRLVYYGLWLITVIASALALYAFCHDYYMDMFTTLIVVIGATLAVLIAFILCTDMDVFLLILVAVPIVVFGCYLAYDMRTNVRSHIFDHDEENPVGGAVRIWMETVLVFCRFGEMVGNMFTKQNLSR